MAEQGIANPYFEDEDTGTIVIRPLSKVECFYLQLMQPFPCSQDMATRKGKMKSLVNYKTWTCTDCGDDYQGSYGYINLSGDISCVSCLDFDIPMGRA